MCELQVKYQEGKKELSSSLYATMAATEEMKLAKAAMELQSQVCSGDRSTRGASMIKTRACVCVLQNKYKQKSRQEMGSSLFHQMPETSETEFVKQISDLQSEVRLLPPADVSLSCPHAFPVLLSDQVQEGQRGSAPAALLPVT